MKFKKDAKLKKIAGLTVLGLGAILIALSVYAKVRIGEAKDQLNNVTRPLGKNPFSGVARDAVEHKAKQYEQMVMWCTTGGIILVLGGGVLYFMSRKK